MAIKPTSREIKVEETRQLLFETSLELFNEYSFDKVTIDDICAHSGISKGAFYRIFQSKEDLVVVAFIKYLDKYLDENFIVDDNEPFQEQITSFVLCIYHFASSMGKAFTRRSYQAQISTQLELKIPTRRMVIDLFLLIKRGKSLNMFKVDFSDDELYTYIIGSLTGLLVKWSTDVSDQFDWEKMIKNQVSLMLK